MLVRRIVLAVLCSVSGALHAQYPAKPVTLVVAYPPGSDADLSARNVAQHAQKYLGNQPIIVINRPGASGMIGTLAVRNASADGYTLLAGRIASHAILPAMDRSTPYRWNDFTMLSVLERNPYVCAAKSDGPYKSMRDLLADIRRNPGRLNFSTAGVGTLQNLGPQFLMSLVGLPKDAAVGIQYKGSAELVASLLGGQVQFACNNLGTLLPHIKAGSLRPLMTAARERLPDVPDVPTARELGWPEMESLSAWTALMGPLGLTKDVTERWSDVLSSLARDPAWLAGNDKIGGIPAISSSEDTTKFVRGQYEFYDKLITGLGIRQ